MFTKRILKEILEELKSIKWILLAKENKKECQKEYRAMLEEKWKVDKAQKALKINEILQTKGEEIRRKREELYNAYLKADRMNKEIAKELKAKVEILDEIFGGQNEKKNFN